MATDLEKLVVQLSADFKGFEKALARQEGVANKQFGAIERRARQMNKNLDGILSKSFTKLSSGVAAIGSVLGANELRKMTDTWTDLTSRIDLATGSHEKGTEVMGRLGEMARRTYSDLTLTAESYLANSTALKELGYSTDQSLDYTEALNNALVVSGAKGEKAARVQDALAKAMGLGKLQGQNLNTILADGGRVADALAAGLGTTVGSLRKLGQEGKITGRVMVDALSSQMVTLRKEAEAMPATIGDGFTLLNNALLQYVGNADSATGVSAKISEALIVIADNFDKVADAGLQVAAVLAGVLVGRSLGNMLKTLGDAGVALNNFRKALTAVRTMGGLATAIGGLSAAAGPLGMVIGGALVGSLALYASNASEAAQKSQAFEKELESLGLLAPRTAKAVDEVAGAVDGVGKAQSAQKLRSIADEIDRIRTSGGTFLNAVGDELNSIARKAATGGSIFGSLVDDKADSNARAVIVELATGFRDLQLTSSQVKSKLDEIRTLPISDGVKDLVNELDRSVQKVAALQAQSLSEGVMPGLQDAQNELDAVINRLDHLEKMKIITSEQRASLEAALTKLRDTGEGADTARAALAAIGGVSFSTTLMGLDQLIGKVATLFAQAELANKALGVSLGPDENKSARATVDPYIVRRNAENEIAKQFEKNALRRAGLKKDELALENKIAEVRKRLEAEGVASPEKGLAERIAKAELAAEAARSAEGKKPKKEKKERDNDYERLTKSITDRTAAMIAETEVQRQLNPLIDDYDYAIEKARATQELLNAAQKAGVEITPEMRKEIAATAEQWALATVEANKLAEAQDKIRQNAQEMAEFQKDLTRGVVDGFMQGKKAADVFAEALSKIGNKLLDIAFNGMFDTKGGGGGLLGGIGKILGFSDGGYTGAGGVNQPAGVVHKGEVVWSQRDVARAGGVAAVDAMRRGLRGYSDGGAVGNMPTLKAPTMPILKAGNRNEQGGMNFAPVYHIDARGADQAAIDRLERGLKKTNLEMESRVLQTMRKAPKSNWK